MGKIIGLEDFVPSGRAFVYVRSSPSTDRVNPGAGLEVQEQECRAFAAANGMDVVGIHKDVVSGGTEAIKRPGLMAALASLGPGDTLLAHKLDRVARDTYVFSAIERTVADEGARLVTTDLPETEGPDAALMRSILAAFASYERTRIAVRTYRGKLRSVAKGGHWGGRPPFGTTYVDGQLQVHPEELEVILKIRKMTIAGASQEVISEACDAPRGGKVQVKTISKIQRGVFVPVLAAAIRAREEGAPAAAAT